jgi:tetratricopeptide (TPR) repeat protein
MYKSDPALAIGLLTRLSLENEQNLAYRLTLADMYKDRGRVNDAIRLWFEILAISRDRGIVNGEELQVYFIPVVPYQEEGVRPYALVIDKALAHYNIGLIYSQNAFYEEASKSYSKAAEKTLRPERKAFLYHQAGMAIGSKKVEFFISDKDGKPYQKIGDRTIPVDPMQYLKKEAAFYEMALAFNFSDEDLRNEIERSLRFAMNEIQKNGEG